MLLGELVESPSLDIVLGSQLQVALLKQRDQTR